MSGHVLTLNAGSSSIKFALFDVAGAAVAGAAANRAASVGASIGGGPPDDSAIEGSTPGRPGALTPRWRPEWIGIAEGLGADREATATIRDARGAIVHEAALGRRASHRDALSALLAWQARAAPG